MSNRAANKADFDRLPREMQDRLAACLIVFKEQSMSVRCEIAGGQDFQFVVAPGYGSAQYWLDRFDIS